MAVGGGRVAVNSAVPGDGTQGRRETALAWHPNLVSALGARPARVKVVVWSSYPEAAS